jgi:hypothetical protein
MYCVSCGTNMKDGAKSCGSCGTEVVEESFKLRLAPLVSGLKVCETAIMDVATEEPDSDGDFRSITIRLEVHNTSDQDWDYLSVNSQIFATGGQIVDDRQESFEQVICAGEKEELETSFYGIKAKLFGDDLENSQVVVSVYAASLSQQKLGQFDVPEAPFATVAFKPVKVGESIQLVSGGMWRTEPDDAQNAQVEVKLLVQNLTNFHLPEVKLVAEVTDKAGKELADAVAYEEVRPGSLTLIGGSGYTKSKKLKGSKVDLTLHVLTPVSSGFAQRVGVRITPEEAT